MKKFFRFGILLVMMLMLTGCHAKYETDIIADKDFMDGKIIDILVPMNENDEKFLNTKTFFYGDFRNKKPEYVRDTEIYNYNENGYVSMICHYPLSDYIISEKDGLTVTEIYLNGKYEFKNFCEKYKKFKIAVLDTNGNILSVSEEYDLISKNNCYIKSPLEYSHTENKLSYEYEYDRSFGLVFAEFGFILLMNIFSFVAVIHFMLVILVEYKNPKKYHIFIMPVYCLPSVLYLAVRLDYIVHTVQDNQKIFSALYSEIKSSPLTEILWCSVPYIVLTAVCIWYTIRALTKDNKESSS